MKKENQIADGKNWVVSRLAFFSKKEKLNSELFISCSMADEVLTIKNHKDRIAKK